MPQMSPIIWEMFILISILNLILLLAYFNYLSFKSSFSKKVFSKSLSMIYKW